MDEQNFKFNYVFQGQDCTLSTGVYKITIQNHVTSVVQQSLLENGGDNTS